jgi:hypothetical protein
VVVIKNKSHAVTAQLIVPDSGANGVIVAQGGAFGGWTLYTLEGRLAYCYNLLGLRRFKVYGDQPIPTGEHQPGPSSPTTATGWPKAAPSPLYVDSTKAEGIEIAGP